MFTFFSGAQWTVRKTSGSAAIAAMPGEANKYLRFLSSKATTMKLTAAAIATASRRQDQALLRPH